MGELEGIQAQLDRIERAVQAGDTDLSRLGFWRVLKVVKADPVLAEGVADQAGRIDQRAFRARVRPLFPVWSGNAALLAGVGVGVAALVVSASGDGGTPAGIALVVAAGAWAVSVHGLAHWVVGRAVGIRFTAYFFGGPPPPRPGLKTDYATYLRASATGRAWMHASGAIATKIAPFAVLALYPLTDAPAWSAWVVLALGVVQILTDALVSVKTSDWMKFKREMSVARRTAG